MKRSSLLLLVVLVLSGCSNATIIKTDSNVSPSIPSTSRADLVTRTPTRSTTPSLTNLPSLTATVTIRPTVTTNLTPTTIPTATPFILPVQSLQPISGDNLAAIREIAEWQQAPQMSGLAFNADGSILAAANLQPHDSFPIKLWSTKDGRLISSLAANGKINLELASSPNGITLAAAFSVEGALLWDMQSGSPLSSPQGESSTISLAFSPDSKTLAYGTAYNAQLYLWDLSENRLIRKIDAEKHDIYAITFSPDGHEIITVGGVTGVEVWNSSNGQLIRRFRVLDGCTVFDSAISDSGYIVFLGTSCPKYYLEVQKLSNWQVVLDIGGFAPLSIAFLPSTDILVVSNCLDSRHYGVALDCTKSEILFLDVETGEVLSKIQDAGEIVEVSPDGKRIASANLEGKIQIWGVPGQ